MNPDQPIKEKMSRSELGKLGAAAAREKTLGIPVPEERRQKISKTRKLQMRSNIAKPNKKQSIRRQTINATIKIIEKHIPTSMHDGEWFINLKGELERELQ